MLCPHPSFTTFCAVTCSLAVTFAAVDSMAAEPTRPLTVPEMAMAYRVQAYLNHHHNRAAYERHRKASAEMLQKWRDAGSPDTAEVAAWFQNARQAAIAGQTPPPVLDLMPVPTEQLVEAKPQPEIKPALRRTRPASVTKPAATESETESETEPTLPAPNPIVPPEAYDDGAKPSESSEAQPESPPVSPAPETEGSPVQEPATDVAPEKSARPETKSHMGTVRSTLKAFLRAVTLERE